MLADLRDALRQLRKAPGFTTTAVVTLALGIGATTAIFTLVHQVMLKSLPVTRPDELWRIGDKIRCCNWGGYTQGEDGDFSLFSWEAYKNFREHTPEFARSRCTPGRQCPARRPPRRIAGAGGHAQRRIRLRKFLQDARHSALDRPPHDGRGRSGGRSSRRGHDLSRLEREVRLRSLRRGRQLSDQRPSLHHHRRRAARISTAPSWRVGHARFLDSADHRTAPRWSHSA